MLRFQTPRKKIMNILKNIPSSGSENHEKYDEFFERKRTFFKMFLCTCKMPLWPPCRKIFVKTLKTICSNSGNDEKFVRFSNKNISPQHVRRNMHNEVLASLPQLCCQEYEKLSQTPKTLKLQFSEQKYFFYKKCFFSNRECNFDNHTKKLSSKNHRFAAQIPRKTDKITNFLKDKYFSSKCSHVNVEFSCDNPAKKLSSKLWKHFAGIPERMQKWKLFRKTISLQSLRLNMCKEILTSLP